MYQPSRLISFALLVCLAGTLNAREIRNWSAPPFWNPGEKEISKDGFSTQGAEAVAALPTPPVPFVGITPCRIVDTRGNGFTGAYGPPALGGNATARVFNVPAGPCPGIPADAAAFSINIAAILPAADGFLTAFPTGETQPNASTLNYLGGEVVANAAVIAAGTSGSISVFVNVTTHVIIDINGYYAGSVVTTLNGLSGNVSVAAGSNVTITPSGQTLTVAATAGPGGQLPVGSSGQTLRHDGSSWLASSALTNDGTNVALTGALGLPTSFLVTAGAVRFLHNFGPENTFLGASAGNLTLSGGENTGIGAGTLFSNTFGFANTAIGVRSLQFNSTGNFNTAIGRNALKALSAGDWNTAVGSSALELNGTGDSNTAVGHTAMNNSNLGNNNTAVGASAMHFNYSGNSNTALGDHALTSIYSGGNNIGIGAYAGQQLTTGSNNIYIGNQGSTGAETGQIRIGTVGVHTAGTVIVGIHGFSAIGGIPVLVNSGGRLGTSSSSSRFKTDIREIGEASEGLMSLRPVAFRYKPDVDPTGLAQYGLIAEEVAEIYPELVVYDENEAPYTVRYDLVNSLLLNEVQRQHRHIEEYRAEMDELKARLARLETALQANPGPEKKETPLP